MNLSPRFAFLSAERQAVAAGSTEHVITLDHRTHLMWAARPLPIQYRHRAARKACREFDLGGFADWRLPSVKRLQTILDRSRFSPAIDPEAFPDTPSSFFWTSTRATWNKSSVAWFVGFGLGGVGTVNRGHRAFVRPVRSVLPAGQ